MEYQSCIAIDQCFTAFTLYIKGFATHVYRLHVLCSCTRLYHLCERSDTRTSCINSTAHVLHVLILAVGKSVCLYMHRNVFDAFGRNICSKNVLSSCIQICTICMNVCVHAYM